MTRCVGGFMSVFELRLVRGLVKRCTILRVAVKSTKQLAGCEPLKCPICNFYIQGKIGNGWVKVCCQLRTASEFLLKILSFLRLSLPFVSSHLDWRVKKRSLTIHQRKWKGELQIPKPRGSLCGRCFDGERAIYLQRTGLKNTHNPGGSAKGHFTA